MLEGDDIYKPSKNVKKASPTIANTSMYMAQRYAAYIVKGAVPWYIGMTLLRRKEKLTGEGGGSQSRSYHTS